MKRVEYEEAAVHPWDLIIDELGTRVLKALPSVRDVNLRRRLRELAVGAMMSPTARRRENALGRLGEVLTSRVADVADSRLLTQLATGEPPDDLTVSLH